jgi:hypothetical protein
MFTYYDDRSVHITSAEIRVDQQRYPLADLHRIWQRRGARSWSALAGRGMVGVAFLAPVVTAILGLVTALTINASPTVTIALIGGSILVGLIIIPVADLLLGLLDDSYDRGAHVLELWAEVRGTPVLLLSSRDALRVGRIRAGRRGPRRIAPPRARWCPPTGSRRFRNRRLRTRARTTPRQAGSPPTGADWPRLPRWPPDRAGVPADR